MKLRVYHDVWLGYAEAMSKRAGFDEARRRQLQEYQRDLQKENRQLHRENEELRAEVERLRAAPSWAQECHRSRIRFLKSELLRYETERRLLLYQLRGLGVISGDFKPTQADDFIDGSDSESLVDISAKSFTDCS